MRVLILRDRPCARARVQAAALASERPEIELGLARQGGNGGDSVVREWELGTRPARALREAIAEFGPDLIHSHGPGTDLTVCANELTAGRIPVIHDTGGRATDLGLERRVLEESDALIVPSHALLAELAGSGPLPLVNCVFPSYPPAHELPPGDRQRSAEAQIGRIATLYEQLCREPLAGIVGELRAR